MEDFNGSQLKNPDISGAIFILSLSILIQHSECVEGAKYVRVISLTPIIFVSPEGTEHFSLSSAGIAFLLNEYFISGLMLTAPIAVEVILSDGFKHSEPKSMTHPILANSVKFFNSQTQGIIAVLISTT